MLRLIQIEFLKLKKIRSFWILLILFVISLASLPIAIKYWLNYESAFGEKIGSFLAGVLPVFDFVDVWQNLAFVYKYMTILLGFLVLISVTNEYSYKTMRQNIIDGLSKREYLTSKILLILFLSVISTIGVFLIGLYVGYSWSPVTEFEYVIKHMDMLLAYFLHVFSFLLLCLTAGLLIKRAALAISAIIFYIFFLEPIITSIIRYKFGMDWLADLFPFRATMSIVPSPFGKYALMEIEDYIPFDHLAINLIYIGIFIFLSWLLVSRRDL